VSTLHDYAGAELVEPSPDLSAARWFASHVLPANPLLARRISNALKKEQAATARPSLPTPVPHTTPPASPASETS
jgi:hypothetical protein